ncbi:MAG TPA: hypothetical protein DCP47_00880 [Phycisphaerales bacterium]|nr:hypothetical protein [Phycisphaerales bacterium]
MVTSLTFADEIKVLSVSPAGEITISANTQQAKAEGCWPFLQAIRFDIFKTQDGVEVFVARIVITQTFPTYCTGILMPRLDGSGTIPATSEIEKGMICRRTVKENLHSERKAYKIQKKAYKRQYKLNKIKAKSGVFKTLENTVKDANGIKTFEHQEVNGENSETLKIEKK